MSPARREQGGGAISPSTLLIASAASAATAVLVHQLWRPAAIVGAAVTPILVALISEALRRPAQRVATVAPAFTARRGSPPAPRSAPVGDPAVEEPPPAPGELTLRRVYRPRARRRLRLALGTGLAAFVVGALALTVFELALGGAVADSERTTLFRGGDGEATRVDGPARGEDDEREAPRPTTAPESEPAPTTTTEPPDATTAPETAQRPTTEAVPPPTSAPGTPEPTAPAPSAPPQPAP